MAGLKLEWLPSEHTPKRRVNSAMRSTAIMCKQSQNRCQFRSCTAAARSSLQGSSGDAWSESGWADEDGGTAQQSFPDVSLLTTEEIDMVLGILPTTNQIRYMKDGGVSQQVLWGVAVLIFILASSREPVLGVAGLTFPLYESIIRAAIRNVRVKTSSAQYIGIWHAEVLSMAMEEGYPGTGPIQSSLRLLIGEVGPAGFTSDIQVPWVSGCEQLRTSDQVEVLVMSSEPYFEDFQVVRDLYVPAIGLWLADYPFLKRDAFQRLSEDIYWSRQDANS